ncbi:unnamed protein product [Nezara viridula]|uniref:Uncharacterized protein n=1 Tax=Nezara viridula TaxID=85310 RepID=A0A9P0HHS7_NEZVI|nr:unnamed protein product [Nezara viridula]
MGGQRNGGVRGRSGRRRGKHRALRGIERKEEKREKIRLGEKRINRRRINKKRPVLYLAFCLLTCLNLWRIGGMEAQQRKTAHAERPGLRCVGIVQLRSVYRYAHIHKTI